MRRLVRARRRRPGRARARALALAAGHERTCRRTNVGAGRGRRLAEGVRGVQCSTAHACRAAGRWVPACAALPASPWRVRGRARGLNYYCYEFIRSKPGSVAAGWLSVEPRPRPTVLVPWCPPAPASARFRRACCLPLVSCVHACNALRMRNGWEWQGTRTVSCSVRHDHETVALQVAGSARGLWELRSGADAGRDRHVPTAPRPRDARATGSCLRATLPVPVPVPPARVIRRPVHVEGFLST